MKLYGGSQLDIDSLIQNLCTVIDDIGMRRRTDMCGIMPMHTGKESEGITTGSGKVIDKIDGDSNKYLGIMERVIFSRKKSKEVSRMNDLNVSDQLSS